MKIYSLFTKKFTAKCPITLGLKFRRKFFEEAKKRGSLVSGFRAQSPPPVRDPRWFHKIRARRVSTFAKRGAREKEERKGFTPEISTRIKHEAIVDGACAVYHDQAWILRDSKPWNRTPTMSRMRIPASAERGSRTGTFLFIFRARNLSGKPSHPVRSFRSNFEFQLVPHSILCVFLSFYFFFLFSFRCNDCSSFLTPYLLDNRTLFL